MPAARRCFIAARMVALRIASSTRRVSAGAEVFLLADLLQQPQPRAAQRRDVTALGEQVDDARADASGGGTTDRLQPCRGRQDLDEVGHQQSSHMALTLSRAAPFRVALDQGEARREARFHRAVSTSRRTTGDASVNVSGRLERNASLRQSMRARIPAASMNSTPSSGISAEPDRLVLRKRPTRITSSGPVLQSSSREGRMIATSSRSSGMKLPSGGRMTSGRAAVFTSRPSNNRPVRRRGGRSAAPARRHTRPARPRSTSPRLG